MLVPPGGLPPNVSQSLDVLRAKLPPGSDVRLDIVLVGPTDIPESLRDMAIRSRGSILTINDIDEIGAIAQRLKNEQTSGSWLVIPQQGTIPRKRPFPMPIELLDLIKDVQALENLPAAEVLKAGNAAPKAGEEGKKFDGIKALDGAVDQLALLSARNITQALKGRVDDARTRLGQIKIVLMNTRSNLDKLKAFARCVELGKPTTSRWKSAWRTAP